MKKCITIHLMLLLSLLNIQLTSAQNDSIEALILFNKGITLYDLVYRDINFDEQIARLDSTKTEENIQIEVLTDQKEEIIYIALDYFEELIDDFPESPLLYRAANNAGQLCWNIEDLEDAIKHFTFILNGNADDMESGGIGEGLMAEPYAMYKNRACKNLTRIYIDLEEYDKALKYLKLTKKYPYQHFCGNEHAANDIYKSWLYTKCYTGLGDHEKALSNALPHILETGLASNYYLVNEAVDIIAKHYDPQKALEEFETAIEEIKVKKKKSNDYEWQEFSIKFMKTTLKVPTYGFFGSEEESLETVTNKLRNSSFIEQLKEQIKN